MLQDRQIARFNPWWTDAGWEADDPHLRRLEAGPIRLATPQVDEVDIGVPAIHVLRGPRQTGKSTDLKLLVRRALEAGIAPRQIVYLSLDLLEDRPPVALVESVNRAIQLAGGREDSRLVLLDEVNRAWHWQTAVKVLWDSGRIDRDVVVCAASSAADLVDGAAERLPGRRGPGRDFLLMPQDFSSFSRAIDESIPPGPGLTIAEIVDPGGQAALHAARIHLPALQHALERYLLFGGLPAAVAEAAAGHPEPSEEMRRVLWDSVFEELQRRGASTPAAQALLEQLMRSLGSKLSWSRLAREMAVPLGRSRHRRRDRNDPRTVQSYVELLAANYFALVLYFWKTGSRTGGTATDKKIYFGDPLLLTVTADRMGLPRDRRAEVENALALALYRRYEPAEGSAENMLAPERLHVWGTRHGGEVDFACGRREEVDAVEVAEWTTLDRREATGPARAFPGRPSIVASRDELDFAKSANIVPAALLLWALSG
ncbi:MAG: ATP-binding protein [Solirubrobacterales bacterium]